MDYKEITEKVIEVINQNLDGPKITSKEDLEEFLCGLGMESCSFFSFQLDIEDEFGINFNDLEKRLFSIKKTISSERGLSSKTILEGSSSTSNLTPKMIIDYVNFVKNDICEYDNLTGAIRIMGDSVVLCEAKYNCEYQKETFLKIKGESLRICVRNSENK